MNWTAPAIIGELKLMLVALKPQLAQVPIEEDAPLLEEGLGLDSIALMELIGQVESRFDLQLDETDLRLSNFANLTALARLVLARLGAGEP
jgi:acyl carrier protein